MGIAYNLLELHHDGSWLIGRILYSHVSLEENSGRHFFSLIHKFGVVIVGDRVFVVDQKAMDGKSAGFPGVSVVGGERRRRDFWENSPDIGISVSSY